MDSIKVNTQSIKPEEEYVCWLDMMGTKNTMSESFERSANQILRFHSAVLKSNMDSVIVYPIMDGVYLSAKDLETMKHSINSIMTNLARVFIGEQTVDHQFIVRGALARGFVMHGKNITPYVCPEISPKTEYKKQLLFGMPMIQAMTSEHKAPPFGIYIHESARVFRGLQGKYYYWTTDADDVKIPELKDKLNKYFEGTINRRFSLELEEDKINNYKDRVKEYFSMFRIERCGQFLDPEKNPLP